MLSAEKTPEPQAFTKTGERSGAGGVRWELRTRDKFCFHKNIHREGPFQMPKHQWHFWWGDRTSLQNSVATALFKLDFKASSSLSYIPFKQKSNEMLLDIRKRRQCFDYFHNGFWNKNEKKNSLCALRFGVKYSADTLQKLNPEMDGNS